ncbi:hypothetical protein M0813_10377 [Anaeramoeba flamelloides]|uniref:Lebercilin domain-containing protein n=1 Tax=Anaeramoeba flamelloides TaxID=1746091 RepID=A0ABQ8X2F9_9EUKA|nr:hypothetical protein M0813_10377 [Anaeramoeba flamelloides]
MNKKATPRSGIKINKKNQTKQETKAKKTNSPRGRFHPKEKETNKPDLTLTKKTPTKRQKRKPKKADNKTERFANDPNSNQENELQTTTSYEASVDYSSQLETSHEISLMELETEKRILEKKVKTLQGQVSELSRSKTGELLQIIEKLKQEIIKRQNKLIQKRNALKGAKTKVKMLKGQLKLQQEEFSVMADFLRQKNEESEIQIGKLQNEITQNERSNLKDKNLDSYNKTPNSTFQRKTDIEKLKGRGKRKVGGRGRGQNKTTSNLKNLDHLKKKNVSAKSKMKNYRKNRNTISLSQKQFFKKAFSEDPRNKRNSLNRHSLKKSKMNNLNNNTNTINNNNNNKKNNSNSNNDPQIIDLEKQLKEKNLKIAELSKKLKHQSIQNNSIKGEEVKTLKSQLEKSNQKNQDNEQNLRKLISMNKQLNQIIIENKEQNKMETKQLVEKFGKKLKILLKQLNSLQVQNKNLLNEKNELMNKNNSLQELLDDLD